MNETNKPNPSPDPLAALVGKCGVVSLSDALPHLVVRTPDGNVHVLPVALVSDVVKGDQPVSVLGDQVIRALLGDYLADRQGEQSRNKKEPRK